MLGRRLYEPALVPFRRMRAAGRAGGSGGLHSGNAQRHVMSGKQAAVIRLPRQCGFRFLWLCHRVSPNLAIASIGQVWRVKLNTGLMNAGRHRVDGRFRESGNVGLEFRISAWRALPAAQRRDCPLRAVPERRWRRGQTGQDRVRWPLPLPDGIPPRRPAPAAGGFRRPLSA